MNKIAQLFKMNGPLESSQYWSDQDRQDTEVYFHHAAKGEVMLTVASSWYGGDVWEFGSGDLNTFRDMLTAYNICGMTRAYPDVRFYACDIFGKLDKDVGEHKRYFDPYTIHGDRLKWHRDLLNAHGLYLDKCHLVQGLFEDTLTQELKDTWRNDKTVSDDYSETALHLPPEFRNSVKRQIGFASLDCNIPSSYKTVLEWIFDAMAPNSYLYLDEGLQSPEVLSMWEQFTETLRYKRNIGAVYIRNAAGFGSLWRLFPLVKTELDI